MLAPNKTSGKDSLFYNHIRIILRKFLFSQGNIICKMTLFFQKNPEYSNLVQFCYWGLVAQSLFATPVIYHNYKGYFQGQANHAFRMTKQ